MNFTARLDCLRAVCMSFTAVEHAIACAYICLATPTQVVKRAHFLRVPGRLCSTGSADAKTAHRPGRRFGAEFCLGLTSRVDDGCSVTRFPTGRSASGCDEGRLVSTEAFMMKGRIVEK